MAVKNTHVAVEESLPPASTSTDPTCSNAEPHTEKMPEKSEWTTHAILTLIGSFFSLFISIGFMNSWGVWQEYYSKNQLSDRTEFDIAWIGSFSAFIMMFGGAAAGLLFDRVGPTPLLGVGCSVIVLAVFMTSLCEKYWQYFLAQGLLLGLGMSLLTIPCVSTVSQHFTKHRGIATGIVIAGSSLGGVVWPIVDDQLLNHHGMSFGWTMRINGFIMIPLAVVVTTFVRRPKAMSQKVSAVASQSETATTEKQEATGKKKTDISILKMPVFLVFVAGATTFNLGMFTPFFFVSAYSVTLGHTASFAFYALSAMNASSLFGRILIGTLADRYGPFNLISMSAVIGAIVCYCWTAATSEAGIAMWSIAYGFTSGAILSLQMHCATALSTKETFGTALGFGFGLSAITGLVGTPISGQLLPHGFLALSTYAASTLMLGAIFLIIGRLMRNRRVFVLV